MPALDAQHAAEGTLPHESHRRIRLRHGAPRGARAGAAFGLVRLSAPYGRLDLRPVRDALELVAPPVAALLTDRPDLADAVQVAPIDAALADTAAFCAAYDVPLEASGNCLVVALRRGDRSWYAACVVLATTRADVNGLVRRRLDARKASFAPMDLAVELTGMEYGGITPLGLPAGWPLLVDAAVARTDLVVVGSGLRRSKLVVPGPVIAGLPGAEVVHGLGQPESDTRNSG